MYSYLAGHKLHKTMEIYIAIDELLIHEFEQDQFVPVWDCIHQHIHAYKNPITEPYAGV